jgi:hypothetical protein
MNGFFQLLIAWGVLLVFVLMLYMIDKLNFVFSGFSQSELPETYTDGLFGELYGKPLWDAMSGLPIPGIDKKLVENLKPHYEPVLRQHIEQVFLEGYNHAREGTLGVPSNNRMIPTPRGALESWLPLHHLTSIYEAGSEFFSKPDADVLRIQQNLDQITSMLYARVGISLLDPYSRTLMVHPIGVERPHADELVQAPELYSTSAGSPVASVDSLATQPAMRAEVGAMSGAEQAPQVNLGTVDTTGAPAVDPIKEGDAGVIGSAGSAGSATAATGLTGSAAEEGGLLLQPNLNNLNPEQYSAIKVPTGASTAN